jgi:DNA mismatch repair ATPase MutS
MCNGCLVGFAGELELKSAMSSLGALIKHLELLADETNTGSWKLQRMDLSGFMRLDSAAVEALRLFPNKKDGIILLLLLLLLLLFLL